MKNKVSTRHNKNTNIYLFLCKKFLLALGVLLLTQLLFRLFNGRIFHTEGGEWLHILWGNLRYGAATIAAFLLPFTIIVLLPFRWRKSKSFRVVSEILYLLPMLLVIVVNLIDSAYYQFTYRRMSSEILGYLSIGGDMGNLVPHFLVDYWYVTLSGIVIVIGFIVWSLRIQYKPHIEQPTIYSWIGTVVGFLVFFVLLRGGFHKQFIRMDEASSYSQMKNTALVINSPYNILRTLGKADLEKVDYMDEKEASALYSPLFVTAMEQDWSPSSNPYWSVGAGSRHEFAGVSLRIGSDADWLFTTFFNADSVKVERKNVVVIVLESFSQEYMGCYNKNIMPSFTPFLDSLAQRSLLFDGRSNGKKSIEAIPSIFASIPSWMERPYIMSDYFQDSIVGLPYILRQNGYHTAFFHGSYNGSMDFDKFCEKAGFSSYYGRTEYDNDEDWDHAWGIFDEPFLQFMAKKLNTFHQPFFAGVFTLSSHHPYAIPEQHKGEFMEGEHPLLQCVMYTDYALSQFFHACEKQPWYNNTLFIITADHPGQGLHREYNDYDGWYNVPMIFFTPSHDFSATERKGHQEELFQQIDIMPTVLDYLGMKGKYICFGKSHLQPLKPWQIVYGNGYYQLLRNKEIAAFQGEKSMGKEEDLQFLQAVIQQYAQGLTENHLVLKQQNVKEK